MTSILLIVALVGLVVAVATALRARARMDSRLRALAGVFRDGPELAASLDAAEVARRTLAAAEALPGVDALSLEDEESRIVRGASEEEIRRAALQTPPNTNLRAMEVAFRYRLDEAEGASSLLRAGLVVPLLSQGRSVGALTAFTRSAGGFPEPTVAALERLASRAGPALDNAHRFAEARQLADVDSLTGLRNRRCFHELLAREVARASRYDRKLALMLFDLDNFKAINDRIGHLTGDLVLAEVASRVRAVVRGADIACRVGGDEFGVIMPETSLDDAEHLANRLARAVAGRPFGQGHTLYVSAGVAELRPDDDVTALFERADEALYQAKQAGKSRTIAAG